MVRKLLQGIAVTALLSLGLVSTSLPTAAADGGSTSFGPYALASKSSEQVKEVIEYGRHGYVAKDMVIPPQGANKGLKIVAYYPDSKKIRMKATGEWDYTTATYYRKNGSPDCVLTITAGMTIVDYYDETGTTITLKQYWFRTASAPDSEQWQSPVKHLYKLQDIVQMDKRGSPLREYGLFTGTKVPQYITEYNEKAPSDWLFQYRLDGTLAVKFHKRTKQSKVTREEYIAEEGIMAPHVPADLLIKSSHLDEDDFPVLPPAYDWRG